MNSCHLVPLVLALGGAYVMANGLGRRESYSPYYFPPSCFYDGPAAPQVTGPSAASGEPSEWTPEELSEAVNVVLRGACSRDSGRYEAGQIYSVTKTDVMRIAMMLHEATRFFSVEVEAVVSGGKLVSLEPLSASKYEEPVSGVRSLDKLARDEGYFTSLQRLSEGDLAGAGESGS